jgi:hypothetical protein
MKGCQDRRRCGVSRRTFLLGLAAGAAAGSLYLAGHTRGSVAASADYDWSQWLLDAFNREAVRRFGNAYREAHPQEADAAVLADAIDRALAATEGAETATDDAGLAALMQQRVRDEFVRGEVVRVTGWTLSVTEARLYALVSIGGTASGAS